MIGRLLRWTGGTIVGIFVLLSISVAWLVTTESGARWLLAIASPRLPAALQIEAVNGSLMQGLNFRNVSWNDEKATVSAAELDTRFELMPVFRRMFRINSLDLRDVEISISDAPASDTDSEPFSIDLPLTLQIVSASIRNARIATSDRSFDFQQVRISGQLAGSTLELERFDLESKLADFSVAGDADLSGEFAADATAAWELRLPDQPVLSGILKLLGDASGYDVQHDLDAPYEIQTSGTLALVDTGLSVDLTNTWRLIRIERGDAAVVEASSGKLRIVGPTANLNFDGATTLRSGDIPAIAIETRGSFVGDRIDFESLTVANDWARLFANGELLLSPEPSWRFDVELTDVEPAIADDRLSGKLEIIGKTSGRIANAKPLLDFDIRRISGDLNGYTVDGKGKLSYAKEQLTFDGAVVRVGDNRVDFDGSWGRRLEVNAKARFSDLSQFGLGVAGRINGDVRLASDLKTFQATGDVSAADLAWGDYVVDTLEAEIDLPVASKGTVKLQVSSAEQGTVSTEIDGQFENQQWNGSVRKLVVLREPVGEWALREAADIALSQSHLKLAKLCLAKPSIDGLLCATVDYDFSGPLQFESSINALPLSALPPTPPEGASILGVINASATGTFANGRLDANASLQIDGLGLVASFEGDEVAARFEKASVIASVVDNRLVGEFEFRLDNTVDHAAGRVEVADLFDPRSDLLGNANLEFNDLTLASFFVPDLIEPTGKIFGRIDAGGDLMAPEFVGEVGLSNGSVDIRRAGISVTEIELLLSQSKAGELALKGRAKSGDGYLGISGKTEIGANTGIRSEIRLDGEGFELIHLPDWRITTSPAIAVVFDERATRVSGELSIPEASITIKSIPEATEKPSSDVVVHRGGEAAAKPGRTLFVDVSTNLGSAVSFSGFGLTTGLDGSVRITGASNSPYQGFGRVVLREGRYKAYGQNLEIESGELVFNGPLGNPALNVRANRTATDNTVAGIHLTGTPASLRSEVYSEPPLADAEALSYLLTGRPLTGANAEEGDMLSQAAFALGLTTAGSVASRVRNELGLETLGIKGDATNRQFFAGKRLGDRLFIEYAYGVVDSLGTLLLRYQLSRRLMVESRSGSLRTVDIVYSVKRP